MGYPPYRWVLNFAWISSVVPYHAQVCSGVLDYRYSSYNHINLTQHAKPSRVMLGHEVTLAERARAQHYYNVAYGVPKYTATRNNKLFVVSFLAKSLVISRRRTFRTAVPYVTYYIPDGKLEPPDGQRVG